jgi:hypothetical protein
VAILLFLSLVSQPADCGPADSVQDSWRDPVVAAYERGYSEGYRTGYNAAVVLANEKLAEAKARHIADLRAIKAQLDEIRAGLNPPRTAIRGESKVRFYPVAPPRWPYQEWRGSE